MVNKKKLHPNIESLARVARELGPLLEKVVFVGGATTTLYITKGDHSEQARGTVDVDLIADVDRRTFYKTEETLRKLGFRHDQKTNYRFTKDDLIVDLIPIDSSILGFSNRWYEQGFRTAEAQSVDGVEMRILSFPYFLATKLEAFAGRGKGDYLGSKDFEDIVTVLAGRKGFLREMLELKGEIRIFIQEQLAKHVKNEKFRDALRGHVPRVDDYEQIIKDIESDISEFAKRA